MTFTITERDKRLLILVSCALVALLCVRYLIMPASEKKQTLESEIEELEIKKSEWEMNIASIPVLDESIKNTTAERDTAGKPYYEKLENREIDTIITNIALEHGLFPQSMTISAAVPAVLAEYTYYTPQTENAAKPIGYVLIGSASLSARGDADQWTEFLDDILENYSGLRVTEFRIEKITYLNENRETVETHSIFAEIDVYMYVGEEAAA